jgi:hypothetical protein
MISMKNAVSGLCAVLAIILALTASSARAEANDSVLLNDSQIVAAMNQPLTTSEFVTTDGDNITLPDLYPTISVQERNGAVEATFHIVGNNSSAAFRLIQMILGDGKHIFINSNSSCPAILNIVAGQDTSEYSSITQSCGVFTSERGTGKLSVNMGDSAGNRDIGDVIDQADEDFHSLNNTEALDSYYTLMGQ